MDLPADIPVRTLQFFIPKTVSDALPIEQVAPRARVAGIERPRLEYSVLRGRTGEMHITCRIPVALFLVEQLRILAGKAEERHETDLLIGCAKAVATIFAEIEASTTPGPPRPSTGAGPTPY